MRNAAFAGPGLVRFGVGRDRVLAGGLGCRWRPVAAEDGLSVGAGGAGGSVGQEFDFPAQPVDADVMVILAEHDAVGAAGLPAVLFVFDVVDVAVGGAAVAAAGPGAALVAGDDGLADGVGDGVGVADVEDRAFPVEGGVEEAAAQRGGERPGAGDEVDREAGEGVLQVLPLLGRQRLGLGGVGGGLVGPGGEPVPGVGGVGVGVGDQGDHLPDERPVGAAGHDR